MKNHSLSPTHPEEGPLSGRRVAFTGQLAAMSRREAFRLVRRMAGEPTDGVSRRTDILVVGACGWPILPDGTVSRKLQQAEKLQSTDLKVEIISERAFLERLGAIPPLPPDPATCTVERACRLLGLPKQTVRRCEQFGLIRPRDGGLAFQDLLSLRTISALLQGGLTPTAVAGALARLARVLPEFAYPLAQVRLIAEAGGIVAELHGAKIDQGGQLLLDFAAEARQAAPSIRLEHRPRTEEAGRWLETGLEHESEGDLEEAARDYRRALELHPAFAEAHYNLANLLLRTDDLGGAERHYREAVRHAPELACAWYNLGHVLAESSRFEEAVKALHKAAAHLPFWADAHFNLALCLEELGQQREAATHWRAYLRLDPSGDWAEMARGHLRRGGLLLIKRKKG